MALMSDNRCNGGLEAFPIYTFDTHDAVNRLPADAWDQLVGRDHVFLSRPYLLALESAGVPMRHVVFRMRGYPVGAASFQTASFNGAPLKTILKMDCAVLSLISRPLRAVRAPLSSNVLVCGTPFASGEHGYVFDDAVPVGMRGRALVAAAKRVKAELRDSVGTSGVLFKEFRPGAGATARTLGAAHYVNLETEPSMVLSISPTWRTFDDYLACLSSRYRVKAKRAYAKSASLTVRDLTLADLERHRERLEALYDAVARRAQFKLGGLTMEMAQAMRVHMGDAFVLKGYFLGERLVGFLTGFENGGSLEAGLVGIDYTENRSHSIYPRMLCDYLLFALERGLLQVNYGRTAGEIKSTLGAVPVAMSCCVKLDSPLLNAVLAAVKDTVRPEPFPFRKPFTKAWYAGRDDAPEAAPAARGGEVALAFKAVG